MTLYELMNEYASENPSPSDKEDLTPELGKSLSLLHSSLIQCDLENEEQGGRSRLTANPCDIEPSHLSHFIVAYLPFNSISKKAEINLPLSVGKNLLFVISAYPLFEITDIILA